MSGYNGWKNYETWNVALWIGNDEGLYNKAKEYAEAGCSYDTLANALRAEGLPETQDGVSWNDSGLDRPALDEMMGEL